MVALLHPANQSARFPFLVDVEMKRFYNVSGRVPGLPYNLRNEAFLPADSGQCKLGAKFVIHPVSITVY